jgi:hypothetical protein
MGRVVDFNTKKAERDPSVMQLVRFSAELDQILLRYANDPTVNAGEIASVYAHRLGCFLALLEQKEELWSFCERVLKKQAHID